MRDYNGWTNKATWLAVIWFNDSLAAFADEDMAAEDVKETVESYLDDVNLKNGFTGDLLSFALAEINYAEIAAHYAKKYTEGDCNA